MVPHYGQRTPMEKERSEPEERRRHARARAASCGASQTGEAGGFNTVSPQPSRVRRERSWAGSTDLSALLFFKCALLAFANQAAHGAELRRRVPVRQHRPRTTRQQRRAAPLLRP
jgi:hypothetical protein